MKKCQNGEKVKKKSEGQFCFRNACEEEGGKGNVLRKNRNRVLRRRGLYRVNRNEVYRGLSKSKSDERVMPISTRPPLIDSKATKGRVLGLEKRRGEVERSWTYPIILLLSILLVTQYGYVNENTPNGSRVSALLSHPIPSHLILSDPTRSIKSERRKGRKSSP